MPANDILPPHDNVIRIRRPEYAQAAPSPSEGNVLVRAWKRMTPDETRRFAVDLLHMADVAESTNDQLGAFGYDPLDSHELERLQGLIEEHLGWEDDEQEVDSDHAARVIQAGKILKGRLRKVEP